jgi:D-galactarolactone cycloisomerase
MPKIADIRAIPLAVHLGEARAFGHARGRFESRGSVLIEVTADDGSTGFGEAWGAAPKATLGYLETVRPFYLGRDIFDRASAWNAVLNKMYSVRLQNQLTAVASGINMALYDLAGRHLGVPVWKLLGGSPREAVPVYASGGYFCNDPANQLEHQLARVVGEGYSAYKIKIGQSPRDDVARVRLAREMIGPDALLMVDVNGAYNGEAALQSMRAIAPFDVHWMEEPVPAEDYAGLSRLGRHSVIPVASGEAHVTAHEFRRLLETGGVDILMPDLTLCGGLDEGMGAIHLARVYGARISPHVWGTAVGLAAAAHYVASIPAEPFSFQSPWPALAEYDYSENPFRDELLTEPLLPTGGMLPVPQGPGLGVEIDRAALEGLTAG